MAKVQTLPVRYQILPNAVMGMLIFVVTEVMFFSGLISAFLIVKGAAAEWPPPGQPRLPVEATALNTAALLVSGFVLFLAGRAFDESPQRARRPLLVATLLGALFVGFQGVEWVRLIGEGLTLTSGLLGSFFYLIVGLHGLHALAALTAMTWAYGRLVRGSLPYSSLAPIQIFWYFVVGVWPVLYYLVYL